MAVAVSWAKQISLFGLLNLLSGALVPPAGAQDLFLADAHIVDPAKQEIRAGNLLILAGRIVGEPAAVPADFEGTTLSASGKWVIPGLVDLHTHSYGNMAPGNTFDSPGTAAIAERMLTAGVTAFLDLFGREDDLYALRERQRVGEAPGADLFASLSCLTATEGHCTEYGVPTRTMNSPEEARHVVADLAKKRPDAIKIVYAPTGRMPSIDKKTLVAARRFGVAPGDEANLVVLEASPIPEIENTQEIVHVIHHGVLVGREGGKRPKTE